MKGMLKKIYYAVLILWYGFSESLFYIRHFNLAAKKVDNLNYRLLYIVHSLEKGLCHTKNPRLFGQQKIAELMHLIDKVEPASFEYNLGLSILDEYRKFCNKHRLTENATYEDVLQYLKAHAGFEKMVCGAKKYEPKNSKKFDYWTLVAKRSSVRRFASSKTLMKDVADATRCAIQSPSACNRQMIKNYFFANTSKKRDAIESFAQGLSGFDTTNASYSIITYDEAALMLPREQRQGMFNAGLFATNYVNALHSLGIGSCFVQFANDLREEKKLKRFLGIPKNERIAVIIVLGKYVDEYIVPCSKRKPLVNVLVASED